MIITFIIIIIIIVIIIIIIIIVIIIIIITTIIIIIIPSCGIFKRWTASQRRTTARSSSPSPSTSSHSWWGTHHSLPTRWYTGLYFVFCICICICICTPTYIIAHIFFLWPWLCWAWLAGWEGKDCKNPLLPRFAYVTISTCAQPWLFSSVHLHTLQYQLVRSHANQRRVFCSNYAKHGIFLLSQHFPRFIALFRKATKHLFSSDSFSSALLWFEFLFFVFQF